MRNIIIVSLIIMVLLFGTILSRSTFEEWEGPLNWNTSTGGNGGVAYDVEDPNNDYQTQAHGEWSFRIKDPDNSSYANAYKTFSNSSSEYMVEFYMWIRNDHASIDSFPLCVLWNMPALGLPAKTDIALVIDTLNNPPNGGLFTIHVEDADSIHHNEAIIDSTDRWYKIQIYRQISGNDTVVTFYFDGDFIDTYVPMNKDKVSNKISLGTTVENLNANGEIFVDDVIVTNCHIDYADSKTRMQRIDQKEMLVFLSEVNEYFSRIQPYLIYRNYRYFTPEDIYYVVSLSNLLSATFEDLTRYEKFSYFNELVVKIDQIKLGLLYGNLNEVEKGIVMRSLGHVIDSNNMAGYNAIIIGGDNE